MSDELQFVAMFRGKSISATNYKVIKHIGHGNANDKGWMGTYWLW
jgi:hypothetical protein